MANYIDRECLLRYLEETVTPEDWLVSQYNADWVYSLIEAPPTACVVEVVRCNDCKHKVTANFNGDILIGCDCSSGLQDVYVDGYCSYGERREE